jgi:hypothetical protein
MAMELDKNIDSSLVTFIIPSIGRYTLHHTILSLINQTCTNWNAIIVFDGCKNNIDWEYIYKEQEKDEVKKEEKNRKNNISKKITCFEIEKTCGVINQASDVRNYGIQKVEPSVQWIGFVDDDDTIHPHYVQYFLEEYRICDFDVYIYRMIMDNRIIPAHNCYDFTPGDVGISFLCKKEIFDNIYFQNSHTEDFDFLANARNNNYKLIISEKIYYYVKQNSHQMENYPSDLPMYHKIFINCLNPMLFLEGLKELL